MEECSTGALVPAVKPEPKLSSVEASADPGSNDMDRPAHEKGLTEVDKDLLCPICMQLVKDAFLTACGHSFCYMCIITHLRNKSDCPCCAQFLSTNQLFPNFLLDKLLKKASARQISKSASPVEHFRQALQQVQTHLQFIKEDIGAVERRRMDLYRARDRYSVKLRMLGGDDSISGARKSWPSSIDNNTSSLSGRAGMSSWNLQSKKLDGWGLQKKDALSASDSQYMTQSGLAVARKKRVHAQFDELQECYLQKRRQWRTNHIPSKNGKKIRMRVIAELRHGDLFHPANIVSSIEFDRDYELFATAGVSRCIKVFDFSSVVNDPADVHCPVVEMPTRSKLSCLSWNKFTKNHIASTDYEGIVTVWDVNTRQSVMEYEEHEKRAWSVDFSCTEPTRLVSGSDDCKVKVWCTRQESSVLDIDMKANICCVKYNPGSSNCIAVGSADHHIHYYDLRNPSQPLHVFTGHKKAVSYVKFLSNYELASASTDSTLRLWNVKENIPVRTFKGHTNEKNFVGLTVNGEYIACGSETNEVFVYHKEISKPVTWHRFGSPDLDDTDDDAGSYFISAVCWKSDSPTMLTANSQGTIKVLVLAA
ncbi:E3 ubiquitin-protein ligase COP1 [Prunus yedoensis var. nudiflora]|uniref:E3 ubiquitin-protein ligase COP1 n=1 Tax=Prunus yedoensis var. nudiflora TaxID=2094558 RepID=A0A314Z8Z0_PRUYE|nr:E3 ubiquitin-protein ligase COP1 [Prunus yedoensis var. nudiflora]